MTRLRHLAPVLAAIWAIHPAMAQVIVGPGDVVPPDLSGEIGECLRGAGTPAAQLACFDHPGVSLAARQFAAELARGTALGLPGILTGFTEAGWIDVAEVTLPTLANTNIQSALVNGRDGPQLTTELAFALDPPDTGDTAALRRRYPDAVETSRVAVIAVRNLPDGGQRFVLSDVVSDGCRACEVVGHSLTYADFLAGRWVGSSQLGWFDAAFGRDPAAALRQSDIRVLQDRLNALGYAAGPVDGVPGGQTMRAFFALKRDHCLPEDRRILPVLEILTRPQPDLSPAPCAPEARQGPVSARIVTPEPAPEPETAVAAIALPLRDGIFAADPRLCPPVAPEVTREFGDRAYVLALDLAGDRLSHGEGTCRIDIVSGAWPNLIFALDCQVEGTAEARSFPLTLTGPDGFTHDGRDYARCGP